MKNLVWKDLYRSWRRHTGVQVATLTILVAAFTVVSILLTASLNLRSILSHWGESVNMTAYLKENINEEQKSVLHERLKEFSDFKRVQFVSKEMARKEFADDLERILPEVAGGSEWENPFPASFRIDMKEAFLKGDSMESIVETAQVISGLKGIESVTYGQDWVKNYKSFLSGIDRFGFLLISVLFIGGFLVIGNSLRTSITQRREEIEILELVGATYASIRRPFVIEGIFVGFLSGVLSILITYAMYKVGIKTLSDQFAFFSLSSQLSFLSISWMFFIVLLSSVMGLMGSYLSVRSLNRGWSASQRAQS